MPQRVNVNASVLVGTFNRTVCVRVDGRGSFQNSVGLKEFVKKMILRGYRDFLVDLKTCELMDSTFMGTLAGTALRLKEIGQGGLKVVNANARNRDLLGGLGLDQLFEVSGTEKPVALPEQMVEVGEPGDGNHKLAALEAHEALVASDPANAVKFSDVIEFLKQDLGEDRADVSES